MPRSVRMEYPGAIYHVLSRGDRREPIFCDDADRHGFLGTLAEMCERTGIRIHGYVLMGNRYHLLLETPEPNLVAGKKWLQGTYTQRFNRRHRLSGHLFQGRYKALPVEDSEHEDYFAAVSEYAHGRGRPVDLRPPPNGRPQQCEPGRGRVSRTDESRTQANQPPLAHMHGLTPSSRMHVRRPPSSHPCSLHVLSHLPTPAPSPHASGTVLIKTPNLIRPEVNVRNGFISDRDSPKTAPHTWKIQTLTISSCGDGRVAIWLFGPSNNAINTIQMVPARRNGVRTNATSLTAGSSMNRGTSMMNGASSSESLPDKNSNPLTNMKFHARLALVAAVSLSSFVALYAQDVPDLGFPSLESQAIRMAKPALSAGGFSSFHQISAVYIPAKETVMVQEFWVDLATNEQRNTYRAVRIPRGTANPLLNLPALLSNRPQHGIWKTNFGDLAYHAATDSWNPAISRSSSRLTEVLKRLKTEWYLWQGTPVFGGCCGGNPSNTKEEEMERNAKRYHERLARLKAGVGPIQIRERHGLIDEILVLQNNGELGLRVTNEYLRESPIALDETTGAELQRRSAFSITPNAQPRTVQTKGRDFGMGLHIQNGVPVVQRLREQSPAKAAGVGVGDVLTKINGIPVPIEGKDVFAKLTALETAQFVFRRTSGGEYFVTLSKTSWVKTP